MPKAKKPATKTSPKTSPKTPATISVVCPLCNAGSRSPSLSTVTEWMITHLVNEHKPEFKTLSDEASKLLSVFVLRLYDTTPDISNTPPVLEICSEVMAYATGASFPLDIDPPDDETDGYHTDADLGIEFMDDDDPDDPDNPDNPDIMDAELIEEDPETPTK